MKIINPEKCVVFFDFDNTIATCDVFDSMLPRFSQDDLWVNDPIEVWNESIKGYSWYLPIHAGYFYSADPSGMFGT